MTTPPRVTRDEFEAALARIHARRRRAGDDHPLALSEDPRDVLDYLRKRGHRGLVADDTGDDAIDAMILCVWNWWKGKEDDLWILEACEATGRKRKAIGAVIGIGTSQGIAERITRGRELLGRAPAASVAPAAAADDGQVRALAQALLAHRPQMPAEGDDDIRGDFLDEIADALPRWRPGAPAPTRGVVHALRFVLGELDDQVPAGTELREIVDAGIQLVGERHATTTIAT